MTREENEERKGRGDEKGGDDVPAIKCGICLKTGHARSGNVLLVLVMVMTPKSAPLRTVVLQNMLLLTFSSFKSLTTQISMTLMLSTVLYCSRWTLFCFSPIVSEQGEESVNPPPIFSPVRAETVVICVLIYSCVSLRLSILDR